MCHFVVDKYFENGENGALMMIDMDNFKAINDNYGHMAGDGTLKAFADALRKFAGEDDIICRIGGDEFCAVVENATEKWIDGRIHELEYLERQYNHDAREVQMHIAHGYAIFDEQIDSDIEETRGRADVKMYENKKAIKASL